VPAGRNGKPCKACGEDKPELEARRGLKRSRRLWSRSAMDRVALVRKLPTGSGRLRHHDPQSRDRRRYAALGGLSLWSCGLPA
jgi:hypothetical protein